MIREANGASLRGAVDAVTRKQRSLDTNSQEYYNGLHSFKYHGDADRKFDRERQGDRQEVDEVDEEIEFLPNENGQLETVGDGYQGLSNKLLERALIDYLKSVSEQDEMLFRELERSSSRKRGNNGDRMNTDNKEFAKLYLEELQDRQDGAPYGPGEIDDEDYLDIVQTLYDQYRNGHNKYDENEGPMSWSELFERQEMGRGNQGNEENEFVDRDQDQSVLYPSPAERRNVNGRYPIGRDFRNYRNLVKSYPITKRSPKLVQIKKQITDPKVAQDLGALFGTQTTNPHNHTHDHDQDHAEQYNHESTSEAPKVTATPKGQKENATKVSKPKSIEVRKKSVDWSQYFGIDRRKKKATFTAGRGTQNQDDEWMLQRYYENMIENIKPMEREYAKEDERKDRLEQIDSELKNMRAMIVEEAYRYANAEDSVDMQKVKDKIMTRMALAYSLDKMRKALKDLRNNVAAQREAQRASQRAQANFTTNYREANNGKSNEKRSNDILEENEVIDDTKTCPELEAIGMTCSFASAESQMLYLPCVMLQICKACEGEQLECRKNFEVDATKVCNALESRERRTVCALTGLLLLDKQPPAIAEQCRVNGDSCLRRYRYGHRYFRNPFQRGHQFHGDYEISQPSDQ